MKTADPRSVLESQRDEIDQLLERIADLDEREVNRLLIIEYLRLVAQSVELGARASGGHTDRSKATVTVIGALAAQLNQPSETERNMVITATMRAKQGAFREQLRRFDLPDDD